MNDGSSQSIEAGLGIQAQIRPIGIDDWSAVRYVHALAFERLAGPMLDIDEIAAFKARVAQSDYTDDLQAEQLVGAWIERELVGTAGWLPTDDTGAAARITSVFVNPIFARLGIGAALVAHVEASAEQAGYRCYTTRATANAVGFFHALGYEISSHGVRTISAAHDIPVIYMRKQIGVPLQLVASGDVGLDACAVGE